MGNSPIAVPTVQLRAGMVNSDTVVDILDVSTVVACFGAADLNGDGVCDIIDASLVVSNFRTISPQTWP